MANSDIVLCQFKHTGNSAVDNFLCSDRKATGRSLPPVDPIDNVDDVETTATYSTVDSKRVAALTATFDRLLDTMDTDGDLRLRQ